MRDVAQIPHVGEHVTLHAESPFYLAKFVVHTPHSGDIDAEVFAEEVDHADAMRQALVG